jgi:hypothetical protein
MKQWTTKEIARLKELYPVLPTAELEREFQPRSLKAIRVRASILKLERDRSQFAAIARQHQPFWAKS